MALGDLFDSTIGTLTSTSYLSAARAVELKDNFLTAQNRAIFDSSYPDPLGADQTQLEADLMKMTSQADVSYKWIGKRATEGDGITTGQNLEWPRKYVPRDGWDAIKRLSPPYVQGRSSVHGYYTYDYYDLFDEGALVELPNNVIPFEIEMGILNLLISFTSSDRTSDSDLGDFKSAKLDGVGQVVWRDVGTSPVSSGTISSAAHDYFRKYGQYVPSMNTDAATPGQIPTVRK